MSETIYNKLVRDRIPEIIEANGDKAVTRVLGDEAYKRALLEKLIEEAREPLESNGSLDERADIAEVLAAIDDLFAWSHSDIITVKEDKNDKRGAFIRRIYLEKVVSSK